jgi:hypothetical protein
MEAKLYCNKEITKVSQIHRKKRREAELINKFNIISYKYICSPLFS